MESGVFEGDLRGWTWYQKLIGWGEEWRNAPEISYAHTQIH